MSDPRDQVSFLAEAGRALAESLDLQATFARVARLCVPRLADVCVFDVFAGTSQRVAVAAADPALQPLADELRAYPPRDGNPIVDAARSGQPVLVENAASLRNKVATQPRQSELLELLGVDELLALPLVARGHLVGVLTLALRRPRKHTPADIELANDLAARAAVAVDNARLYAAEREARALAEAAASRTMQLQSVTAALSSALTVEEVANVIVQSGILAMGASGGGVMLLDPARQELGLICWTGYDAHVIREHLSAVALDKPVPVAHAARTGEAVLLGDAAEWKRRFGTVPAAAFGHHAWAALPLRIGAKIIGALAASFDEERAFSAADRDFFAGLADLCAQALHRAQLFAAERRARSEAEDAVRAREEFLTVAAHELRTPLTPLLLQLGLMRRDAPAASLIPKIDLTIRQVERLARLATNLLDVARLGAGSFDYELSDVRLDHLVFAAVERVMEQAARAGVALTCDARPVRGRWDALRIDQVVTNLLSNALKYGDGKPVHVTVRPVDGDRACVRVRDHGIGIHPEAHGMLFQRFTRALTQREYGGLGLGLYISRQIALAHGGTLDVESHPGAGSTFTLELPGATA